MANEVKIVGNQLQAGSGFAAANLTQGDTIAVGIRVTDSSNPAQTFDKVFNISVIGATAIQSLATFGDSITVGSAASPLSNSYSALVAANLSATEFNEGISGSVLQNSTSSTGNGRDRFEAALTGANKRDAVFVAYGFNDARYIANVSHTSAAFENDLEEVVYGLIQAGYARTDINIITPFYITDVGLTTGSAGFAGQSRSGFEEYVSAAIRVAQSWGTKLTDAYAYMRDNGGASLIGGDDIHPTNAGHAAIFSAIQASAVPTAAGLVSITSAASGSANTIDLAWSSTGSPVSYDVRAYVSGAFVQSQQVNEASTSLALTGVPAGNTVVAIRPVFAGGAVGVWTFSASVAVADAVAQLSLIDTPADVLENCTQSVVGGVRRFTATGSTIRFSWNMPSHLAVGPTYDFVFSYSGASGTKHVRTSDAADMVGTDTTTHSSTTDAVVALNFSQGISPQTHLGIVLTGIPSGQFIDITAGTVIPQ